MGGWGFHRRVRNRKKCTNCFVGWLTGELIDPGSTVKSPVERSSKGSGRLTIKARRWKMQTALTTMMSRRRFGKLCWQLQHLP